jgi:hypothetical protein
MESEDLAWLRAGEGGENNDLILWLPAINAIVTGDSLSDFGDGLDVPARQSQARDARRRRRMAPPAARPTRRIRAARARRADGSRTARARAFLTTAGELTWAIQLRRLAWASVREWPRRLGER